MIPSSRLVDNNTILPYDSQVALIGLVDSLVKQAGTELGQAQLKLELELRFT